LEGAGRLYAWAVRRPGKALLIYWPIAFIGTHIPSPWEPGDPPRDKLPLDKIGHFAGYALLAWLLTRVLAGRLHPALSGVLAVVVLSGYGGIDELTQPAVNRTADWPDLAADVAGAIVGAAVAIWQLGRGGARSSGSPAGKAVAPGAGPLSEQVDCEHAS
jgi:VanZ family protein